MAMFMGGGTVEHCLNSCILNVLTGAEDCNKKQNWLIIHVTVKVMCKLPTSVYFKYKPHFSCIKSYPLGGYLWTFTIFNGKVNSTVMPRLTSDPANEFFG
jgi:hypothetical protein